LPQFFENFISASPAQWNISTQYYSVIIPFIFISLIYGINYLIKKFLKIKNIESIVVSYILICLSISYFFINPLSNINLRITSNVITAHKFINKIPSSVSIATSSFYMGQLSSRERILLFPNPFINCFMNAPYHILTDYILLDLTRIDSMAIGNMSKKDIGVITDITYSMGKLWAIPFKSRMYDVVAAENGIFLFKVKPEFKDKTVKYDYRYPNKFEIIK
jgi:uncharacterized membrane protein